jgi:hypothetical protein
VRVRTVRDSSSSAAALEMLKERPRQKVGETNASGARRSDSARPETFRKLVH